MKNKHPFASSERFLASSEKSRRDNALRVIAGLLALCAAHVTRNLQRLGDAGVRRHDDALAAQSRRDDTLLTVGFNLRETRHATSLQSPAGPAGTTHITGTKCRPCGTGRSCAVIPIRRLKSTVI